MAVPQRPFLAAVVLLVSSGLLCSSPSPACPHPCTCLPAPLLNCSSLGLSSAPQPILDSVAELDFSHNLLSSLIIHQPHPILRSLWLRNNSIKHLSLCMNGKHEGPFLRGRDRLRWRRKQGCVSWAPALQLLSVERNQLEELPQGLEGIESLQVLQLPFNKITSLRPEDLSHLRQLRELDLKHNLISSLHPQIFQNLVKLKVLNLSFNMLTSLHPLTHLSLRDVGADVRLAGNRWQCDCKMRLARRWMALDRSRGYQAWNMVCASPSILAGRDLIQLEDDDLKCSTAEKSPEIHRDVTVYSGSETLLSCSSLDSVWWTPSGPASDSELQDGLLIKDITERDAGLYVCVSEGQVISIFNLQISHMGGAKRGRRDLPTTSLQRIPEDTSNSLGEVRNQRATQSDLALAVCLSILFTFLVAFILGVLARPCVDVLWKRVTKKKDATATHTVSTVEQNQYDNEAYFIGEELEMNGACRERRVTFSTTDFIEDGNVQYYDTVANDEQEGINQVTVIESEVVEMEKCTTGDSGSENSSQDGRHLSDDTNASRRHNIEFEPIPDHVKRKERRSLSSCSDSSTSEKGLEKKQVTQRYHPNNKSPQLLQESVQQRVHSSTDRKVEVQQIVFENGNEMVQFSSEPFADWSPHSNLTDSTLSQENEQQFEFSDSGRSASARSSGVFGSFSDKKQTLASSSNNHRRTSTSSSSYISEDEPTHYTVNSDQEIEQDIGLEMQRHNAEPTSPSAVLRSKHSVSSDSSDCNEQPPKSRVKQETTVDEWKDTGEKVKPIPRTRWRDLSLLVANQPKNLKTQVPSPYSSSSSSSESEAEIPYPQGEYNDSQGSPIKKHTDQAKHRVPKQEQRRTQITHADFQESQKATPDSQWPVVDLQHIQRPENSIQITIPPTDCDSSFSSNSDEKTTHYREKQLSGRVDIVTGNQKHLDSKVVSESSSSSDSEDDFQNFKPQTHDPDEWWPQIDLQHISKPKKRLDIKSSSHQVRNSDSSSGEGEDETSKYIKEQEQLVLQIKRPPIKVSPPVNHEPKIHSPTVDLQVMGLNKTRVDIKPLSETSHSSSSSDSEDENTGPCQKQTAEKLVTTEFLIQSHSPDAGWPAINLQNIPKVKRRLNIKTKVQKQEPADFYISRPPNTVSQIVTPEPKTQLVTVQVVSTTPTKRRAPSPPRKSISRDVNANNKMDVESSSSSDSEEETRRKQTTEKLGITFLPLQKSQKGSYQDESWPAVDLQHIPSVKRCLDIKSSSKDYDSSSSSDSEDDTDKNIQKQEKKEFYMPKSPIIMSQTWNQEQETQLGRVEVASTTPMKRRAPPPPIQPISSGMKINKGESDTSSSSDSGEEATGKQTVEKLGIARLPSQKSKHESFQDESWPTVDLQHLPRVKRSLDIKPSFQASAPFSSSDSQDEITTRIEKQQHGEIPVQRSPIEISQTVSHQTETQWPVVNMKHTAHLKRRLDIKAPPPSSSSSSSSGSEHETTGHSTAITRPLSESNSQNSSWPHLDLQHIPQIKRYLDIKVISPVSDSSFSSESEDETTHIKKQEQGGLHMSSPSIKVSQTVSQEPETQWPAVDLRHTKLVRRRLDIKAPSPSSSSSSSSASEDETMGHSDKLKPGKLDITRLQSENTDPHPRWPILDLNRVSPIKRSLDFKQSSPASDSSSSSDSEDDTKTHIEKQEHGELHLSRQSHQTEPQWPVVNLMRTARLRRRIDIKAPIESSSSSSSSDSEDETTGHSTGITRPQLQSIAPNSSWPNLDLEHIPQIKRRLDIKVPSPASDSTSNSESEDETTHIKKQQHGGLDMSRTSIKVSQTVNHELQWPAVDLKRTRHVRRRLDIKAPSPSSSSSSSSDSEVETMGHSDKLTLGRLGVTRLSSENKDPHPRWPLLDLQRVSPIKRRLDLKQSSPASDSSSSSDSEDDTKTHIEKKEHGKLHMSRLPTEVSQAVSHESETTWPAVDLQHITCLKRRLDVKAPSPSSSSSSSDSEDETTGQSIGITRPPSESKDPHSKWPLLDLQHVSPIKRRLDIKPSLPSSDSLSSSESEDETTHKNKQEQGQMHKSRVPTKVSQRLSENPVTQWPAVDLRRPTCVKRRLDIKAPSLPSSSSSSSDSENEPKTHITKEQHGELHRLPTTVSQTVSHEPETKWPAVDLQHTTRIKRRLDVKAPSPSSSSSSSSDSEDETTGHSDKVKLEKLDITGVPSESKNLHPAWPLLDLQHVSPIKRRLDLKPSSPASDSSSSSGSEDETRTHINKQHHGGLHMSRLPNKVSQTLSREPETVWPAIDLQHTTSIKKHLDIKAPAPSASSSSSSDSEEETSDHSVKLKPGRLGITGLPSESKDPHSRWPIIDLQQIPHIKKRLDIKPASPVSDFSSNSESEDESTGHTQKQTAVKQGISKIPSQSHSLRSSWPAIDLRHTPKVKRRLDIKTSTQSSDSSDSSDSENETTKEIAKQEQGVLHTSKPQQWPLVAPALPLEGVEVLSHPRLRVQSDPDSDLRFNSTLQVKRRLDIKTIAQTHEPLTSSGIKDWTSHPNMAENDRSHIGIKSQQLGTILPGSNTNITYMKRRLDVKAPVSSRPDLGLSGSSWLSRTSQSSSSSSESEDENKKELRPPLVNIQQSSKPELNTKLEKYAAITDDLGVKPKHESLPTTQGIDPELQSRWATMNLGFSRFKRRLDISPNISNPSSPPPDSPSGEGGSGGTRSRTRWRRVAGMEQVTQTDSFPVFTDNSANLPSRDKSSNSVKDHLDSFSTSKEYSNADKVLTGGAIPHVKRYLDVKVSEKATLHQRPSPLSSTSKDEVDQSVPALRLGVPRIKRYLNIRAPSPEPSTSSSSDSEVTKHTAIMTDNDSLITYKRVIMKTPSLPTDSFSSSITSQTIDYTKRRYTVPAKALSFDDTLKKRIEQSKHDTGIDVPAEIRWTGIGHHLPDLSSSTQRREQDSVKASPQQTPPAMPDVYPPNFSDSSSSDSDDEIKQSSRKPNARLSSEYSSFSAYTGSPASGRFFDEQDKSPGGTFESLRTIPRYRMERKGLGALKAMSSERQQWDTEFSDNSASYLFKSQPKQSPSQLSPSYSLVNERRGTDLLQSIPHYRRHDISSSEPPQEAPPPIPTTPLPEEATVLAWRSPQSIKNQEWETKTFSLQQRQYPRLNNSSSLPSENTSYFDYKNSISEV